MCFNFSYHYAITQVSWRLCCIRFRAGKPPVGLHLDVLKSDKLIQVKRYVSIVVTSLKNERTCHFFKSIMLLVDELTYFLQIYFAETYGG